MQLLVWLRHGAVTSLCKRFIDLSLERILLICDTYPTIRQIVYSCDDSNHNLIGSGIFKTTLCQSVIEYISSSLHAIASDSRAKSKMTFAKIRMNECRLYPFALMKDMCVRMAEELQRKDNVIKEKNKLIAAQISTWRAATTS